MAGAKLLTNLLGDTAEAIATRLAKETVSEAPTGIRALHATPHEFKPAYRVMDTETGKIYVQSKEEQDLIDALQQNNPGKYEIVGESDLGFFDLGRIGTGEGAQAFGHGLYFSDEPRISGRGGSYWRDFLEKVPDQTERIAGNTWLRNNFNLDATADDLRRSIENWQSMGDLPDWVKEYGALEKHQKALDLVQSGKPFGPRVYEVNINATPDQLLDWSKPVKEQSPYVLNALNVENPKSGAMRDRVDALNTEIQRLAATKDYSTFERMFAPDPEFDALINERDALSKTLNYALPPNHPMYEKTSKQIGDMEVHNLVKPYNARHHAVAASEALAQAGIPGLQYPPGTISGGLYGTEAKNYVVFDPTKIDIVNKFAAGGRIAKAGAGKVIGEGIEYLTKAFSGADEVTDALRLAERERQGRSMMQNYNVDAWHGSPRNIPRFKNDFSTAEGHYGPNHYFSSSVDDVNANYATPEGADIANRTQRQSEEIQQNGVDDYNVLEALQDLGHDFSDIGDVPDHLVEEAMQKIVRDSLGITNEGAVYPVKLRMENPVRVGGFNQTKFYYDQPYDEANDTWGEPSGNLLNLIDGLRKNAAYHGVDDDVINRAIDEIIYDAESGYIAAGDFERPLRKLTFDYDADGNLTSPGALIADAYRTAGYDSIDMDAYSAFGPRKIMMGVKTPGMVGLTPDTRHYIKLDNKGIRSRFAKFDPDQIDSTDIDKAAGGSVDQDTDIEAAMHTARQYADGGRIAKGRAGAVKGALQGVKELIFPDVAKSSGMTPREAGEEFSKVLRPYEEWRYKYEDIPRGTPAKGFDPNLLRPGDVFVPLFGDRTSAGRKIYEIGGNPLGEPIVTEGGPQYMLNQQGQIWASGKPVISGIANKAEAALQASEKAGYKDPSAYGIYIPMGRRSGDFSTHTAEAILGMLPNSKISTKSAEQFDEVMKEKMPDFPGINSPELRDYLLSPGAGKKRIAFSQTMDAKNWKEAGFPDVGVARMATTDTNLITTPDYHGGYMIGKIDRSNPVMANPDLDHRSYPVALKGEYVGSMPEGIHKDLIFPNWTAYYDRVMNPERANYGPAKYKSYANLMAYQPFGPRSLEAFQEKVRKASGRAYGGSVDDADIEAAMMTARAEKSGGGGILPGAITPFATPDSANRALWVQHGDQDPQMAALASSYSPEGVDELRMEGAVRDSMIGKPTMQGSVEDADRLIAGKYAPPPSFDTGTSLSNLYGNLPSYVRAPLDAVPTAAMNPQLWHPMAREAAGDAPVTPYTGGDVAQLGGEVFGPPLDVAVNAYMGRPIDPYDKIDTALNIGGGQLLYEGYRMGAPVAKAAFQAVKPTLQKYGPAAAGVLGLTAGSEDAEAAGAGLFSKAMKVIRELPMNKMEGNQALAMLKKGGIGPEELQYTGLADTLPGRGTVTKDELIDFVTQNDVQLGETILSKKVNYPYQTPAEWQLAIRTAEARGNFDEADRLINAWEAAEGVGGANKPKFEKWSLPGGGKYQETLITMPPKKAKDQMAQAREYYKNFIQRGGEPDFDNLSSSQKEGIISSLPDVAKNETSPQFMGGHWDQPNVVAHIRTQEFPIPNPEGGTPLRAFNLDELQSDWAQEGRKGGFKDQKALDEWNKKYDANTQRLKGIRDALNARGDDLGFKEPEFNSAQERRQWTNSPEYQEFYSNRQDALRNDPYSADLRAWQQEAFKLQDELLDTQVLSGDVPLAPYVQSTNQWTDLGLKKGLSQALDRNADMFTWTPGDVQAKRYDLSKEISKIHFLPNENGTFHVGTELPNGQEFSRASGIMDLDKIEKTFGKDIAKKVKNGEFTGVNNNLPYISGEDLSAGGQGMKDYYNNIVPKRLTEVIRKATGEKPQFETFTVQTSNGPQQVQGIRLTPEMKAKLQSLKETEGGYFPHFAQGGKVNDSSVNKALQIAAEASV